MTQMRQLSQDYARIECAIRFLEENFREQPSLGEMAAGVNLSEFHFQRLFSRWVGISPKRFVQYLTKEYAKQLLAESTSVLDVSFDSGLSGPGRLHDLFVNCEAVTPGEYKLRGKGIRITYGVHPTPFGDCLLGVTRRGICGLTFIQNGDSAAAHYELKQNWPEAELESNPRKTRTTAEKIFDISLSHPPVPLHLVVRGTNFQIKVWEALLNIPVGKVVSYQDVARHIGTPGATRAVGTAIGRNPIPFLIPCHRVIRKNGEFGNYGGGRARKKAILAWEAARISSGKHA